MNHTLAISFLLVVNSQQAIADAMQVDFREAVGKWEITGTYYPKDSSYVCDAARNADGVAISVARNFTTTDIQTTLTVTLTSVRGAVLQNISTDMGNRILGTDYVLKVKNKRAHSGGTDEVLLVFNRCAEALMFKSSGGVEGD